MAFALTEEQSRAVHDRGGGLLVSAAAGSGKTRVLVERLLDRVTGEGADIDDFLVITYTRAAAAELRARIAQELSDRLAERPRSPRCTPSVPLCCGRAATRSGWTRTFGCATRGRARS